MISKENILFIPCFFYVTHTNDKGSLNIPQINRRCGKIEEISKWIQTLLWLAEADAATGGFVSVSGFLSSVAMVRKLASIVQDPEPEKKQTVNYVGNFIIYKLESSATLNKKVNIAWEVGGKLQHDAIGYKRIHKQSQI